MAPEDVRVVLDYRLENAIRGGFPPIRQDAWLAAVERSLAAEETADPGSVARQAAGLRARTEGLRLTEWREVRGTHGMDWVYDPQGTDTPPRGYSLELAKRRSSRAA